MPRIRYTTISALRIRIGTVESDCWKACAVPAKVVWIVDGRFMSWVIFSTAAVACPSEDPGDRLKLIVTEGNWPPWLMISGCTGAVVHLAIADSGTCAPP